MNLHLYLTRISGVKYAYLTTKSFPNHTEQMTSSGLGFSGWYAPIIGVSVHQQINRIMQLCSSRARWAENSSFKIQGMWNFVQGTNVLWTNVEGDFCTRRCLSKENIFHFPKWCSHYFFPIYICKFFDVWIQEKNILLKYIWSCWR
jgi:hypothetical protein